MLDLQSLVGTTASALAIVAGLLALFDRWASRRQPPAPLSLTSPSGLILLTRPLPSRRLSRSRRLFQGALRIALVVMAWLVSFVAGVNAFSLSLDLLAPLLPRIAAAAAAADLTTGSLAPVDVLGMVVLTVFLTGFLLTSRDWPRRGALLAVALGFFLPNGDLWLGLLR
jgi:hypothetical protein